MAPSADWSILTRVDDWLIQARIPGFATDYPGEVFILTNDWISPEVKTLVP